MAISYETYERVALEDGDEQWEFVCGQLLRKPPMTVEHSVSISRLARQLDRQLDDDYVVRVNSARLRIGPKDAHVPDLCVVPREL